MARPYVDGLHRSGDLTGERVLAFARDGKFDEMTIALSLMGDLPVGHIERAFVHNQVDHLLVIAKAIGLSWETTRAILVMRYFLESLMKVVRIGKLACIATVLSGCSNPLPSPRCSSTDCARGPRRNS